MADEGTPKVVSLDEADANISTLKSSRTARADNWLHINSELADLPQVQVRAALRLIVRLYS